MSAPSIIHDLVRAFKKDERTYYDSGYSEAQVRIEYIDPFLEALGWHPRPDTAYIAEWRDCIVEQSLNVKDEQHKKRADYTCRVGKTPVLIVEAKAPRDDVFTMPTHALQIRRYAHSESLLIGALTNFAQLAIYDGRVPPKHDDGAEIAQLETIRFTEYVEKWDLIESLLSKDAVQRGAQREEVQRRVAKGILPVDQAILAEIDRWREDLAHVIARLNPELNAETLGFAVGRIIDRILFLRVCEARDTEPEGRLKSLLKGPDVYPRLLKLFHLADERYNSGLFYFAEERGRAEKPDPLALRLRVEDEPLKQIISGLYYPQNLKDYSLIPVEILGQVYEQFLGKVIIIPRRGTAKVEDKPAVKKARGVYYTPSYIVNYIVEHTVGKLVEGKTPKQIAKLRVLDPACGSGSFLLGAYQYLLDWYLKYYLKDGLAKHQKEVSPDIYEGYRLTLRERKRILLAHIYGVDIDPQAVEVSKLSMHLKVLDGETRDTVELELKLGERALPDLGKNIKCGNSLISTDILQMSFPPTSVGSKGGLGSRAATKGGSGTGLPPFTGGTKGGAGAKEERTLSDDEISRINPFDWKKEFPAIFKDGGFDAVIGNPPYGAEFTKIEKEYLSNSYKNQSYQLDSYLMFVENGLRDLLNKSGMLGMIFPNPWLTNLLQHQIRRYVITETRILSVVHFLYKVWPKLTVDTNIVILQKNDPIGSQPRIFFIPDMNSAESLVHGFHSRVRSLVQSQDRWLLSAGRVINIFMNQDQQTLMDKIQSSGQALGRICAVNVGIKPYQVGKGKPPQKRSDVDNRVYDADSRKSKEYRQYLRGSDIRRYVLNPVKKRFIKYGVWLAEPRPAANFGAPVKIVMRQTGDSIVATSDERQFLCLNNMHVIVPANTSSAKYFLGIINSRLMNWYYHGMNPEMGEALAEVKKTNVAGLPIRTINFSNKKDKACHDKMVKLVERMLKLHDDLKSEWVGTNQEKIERQIKATDDEIDRLVYELYGLTEDEIRIVESA